VSFSRLLLVAANSKKCIMGEGMIKFAYPLNCPVPPKIETSMKEKSSFAFNSMIVQIRGNEYLAA